MIVWFLPVVAGFWMKQALREYLVKEQMLEARILMVTLEVSPRTTLTVDPRRPLCFLFAFRARTSESSFPLCFCSFRVHT